GSCSIMTEWRKSADNTGGRRGGVTGRIQRKMQVITIFQIQRGNPETLEVKIIVTTVENRGNWHVLRSDAGIYRRRRTNVVKMEIGQEIPHLRQAKSFYAPVVGNGR